MRAEFVKMHGLGNDLVVLDARAQTIPALTMPLVRALADRREGIGCDQLIVIEHSSIASAKMRIFNADGGEVEACGNASRAVALLIGEAALIETAGGILSATPGNGGASIDMGEPRFDWEAIPLSYSLDTGAMPVGWEELDSPVAVNVGNPHVVFFVPDQASVDLARLGPLIENDPLFPERVNVNCATVTSRESIELRVWERGAGLTRACGTGACATAVAAMKRGLVDRTVTVSLPGGSLVIEWTSANRILMTGPATEAFRGSFDWADFA